MSNGRWVGGDFAWVSEDKAEELSANLAFPGEIVLRNEGLWGRSALCQMVTSSHHQGSRRISI
jgi:hypothetical protein